jgi:CHAD domain-containing protein
MAKARPITGLDSQAPTGKNARMIAKVRLEELFSWESYVDNPYYILELHNLRIAAKRLRYTFEVFEDVLPVACKRIVKELVQIQEELGALHDSDVMIALLRLCLGSQDSAAIPDLAQIDANKQHGKEKSLVAPELVADLLDPVVAPSAEERYGLELFLQNQEQLREKQYTTFRQHWYALQARDFRREILEILET